MYSPSQSVTFSVPLIRSRRRLRIHLAYDLKHVRDSLMVVVAAPQGSCEIEFFPDESIEVECFRRDEGVNAVEAAWLDSFIAEQRDQPL